jgi:hypothetical protein
MSDMIACQHAWLSPRLTQFFWKHLPGASAGRSSSRRPSSPNEERNSSEKASRSIDLWASCLGLAQPTLCLFGRSCGTNANQDGLCRNPTTLPTTEDVHSQVSTPTASILLCIRTPYKVSTGFPCPYRPINCGCYAVAKMLATSVGRAGCLGRAKRFWTTSNGLGVFREP